MAASVSLNHAELMDRLVVARRQLAEQSERLTLVLEACRRTKQSCGAPVPDRGTSRLFSSDRVRFGGVEVILQRQLVRHPRGSQRLTPTEWQLLLFLLSRPDVVHSRSELAAGAWGSGYHGRNSEVEVYVSRLRRKLGPAGRLLETVRGQGYRLLLAGEPEHDALETAPEGAIA
jgi:DNA-binding response OmpR family regulator